MRKICGGLTLILLFTACGLWAQDSAASAPPKASAPKMEGDITAADAKALEEGLNKNPDNLTARGELITYYFNAVVTSQNSELEGKREQHVFWLIEHHPESDLAGEPEARIDPMGEFGSTEAYQRGKQLWLHEVENHPENLRVLCNAAQFLTMSDGKTARDFLEKAWALDPNDAQTASILAQSYELEEVEVASPDDKLALAKKAFSLRQVALEKSVGEERFYELGDAAKSAFAAGETAKAEQYATELLQSAPQFKNNWNYGNALYDGNIVLGRIALQRGDVVGAKEHLLAAGQTPGSPQLDSFGPNMTLAKELLEKGERDTVLAYLDSCAKFWKMDNGELQAWTATIKGGGTPDFGANLDY